MKLLKHIILGLSIFWTASLCAQYNQRIATAELDSGGVKKTLPGAQITVCSAWAGNGCTALASIYSDCNGAQALQNPFRADAQGNYSYCAASPGSYLETVTAPGRGQVFGVVVYMSSGGGVGTIGGSGTATYLPIFTDPATIGNSSVTDDGTTVSTTEAFAAGSASTTAGLGLNTTAGGNTLTTTANASGFIWTLSPAIGTIPVTSSSALADGATVTWAIASVPIAKASLLFTTHGGSRTLNITNPASPGNYTLVLTQDATGGEGLTLGTGCTWKVSGGGAGAITLSTGANAIDILTFYFDGTSCFATLTKNYT